MTLPEWKPIPTFEFPPDLLPKVRDFEKFYDLSELDWDQMTEIYEDPEKKLKLLIFPKEHPKT